jgi:hypothetical protein
VLIVVLLQLKHYDCRHFATPQPKGDRLSTFVDESLSKARRFPGSNLEVNMRRLLLVSAASLAMSGSAFAGGLAEPVMEPEVVEAATSSSSGGIIVAVLLLLLLVAAAGGSDPVPVPP